MSAAASTTPLNVVVCGGGRTGHLAAVLFSRLPGVHVTLYTNNPAVVENYQHDDGLTAILPDGVRCVARLDAVTTNAETACRDADVVIVTVPAHVRPQLLERIAPCLPSHKPVYVGAIPGFCGFDWLAAKTFAARDNVVIWGMKDVPHIASDLRPGVSIRMGGAKSALYAATHSRESQPARAALLAHLTRLYEAPVELLGDYLEITLTPGNPIMHSSVLYGLIGPYGQWHETTFPQSLCWWNDCPELGAYFLERSDEENQLLCKVLEERLNIDLSSVKPLKQEIVEAYEEQIRDSRTMLSVLRTNQAYDAIALPLVHEASRHGYVIDREHRVFHEDVAFGLSLLVEMGRRLNVRLPHIEEVFQWNVSYMQGLLRSALDYFPESWPA